LEITITSLKRQLEELRLQPAKETIVYQDKIVYRDKPASDYDRNVSEHESIEETLEVIKRVNVAESEAVYERATKEEQKQVS